MGTGRCGTMSLAKVLAAAGRPCTHELDGEAVVHWYGDWRKVKNLVTYRCALPSVVSDVSLWWLPYVPQLRSLSSKIKFVALKRDKFETVDSFLEKTGYTNEAQAHWCSDPPRPHPWDKCFPNMGKADEDKRSLLSAYWHYYYELCDKFDVPVFDMNDLNDPKGLQKIFDAVGITKNASNFTDFRHNANHSNNQ